MWILPIHSRNTVDLVFVGAVLVQVVPVGLDQVRLVSFEARLHHLHLHLARKEEFRQEV